MLILGNRREECQFQERLPMRNKVSLLILTKIVYGHARWMENTSFVVIDPLVRGILLNINI